MYICQNVHLAEITFPRKLIFQNLHFCQNVHLAEITFPRKLIFQNLHLPECTFGRNYISLKSLFSTIYTCQNVHLAKITFPRKFIFQILYTLNRNFVIDRIYITKVYNYACSFSKIIKLRVE